MNATARNWKKILVLFVGVLAVATWLFYPWPIRVWSSIFRPLREAHMLAMKREQPFHSVIDAENEQLYGNADMPPIPIHWEKTSDAYNLQIIAVVRHGKFITYQAERSREPAYEISCVVHNGGTQVMRHVTSACGWDSSWQTDNAFVHILGQICTMNIPLTMKWAPGQTSVLVLPVAVKGNAARKNFRLGLKWEPPFSESGTRPGKIFWSNSIQLE